MKTFIKIIICLAISFVFQFIFLYYLDTEFFKESKEVTIENVDVKEQQSMDTDVTIPSNVTDIQISSSGKYITYFSDDKLMLVNATSSETTQILEDTDIINIKWVPNNNTLFIVENDSGRINVKTYNANNGSEQQVCELCGYKDSYKINSFISISAEYVTVTNSYSTDIYRIDIDKESKQLDIDISALTSASVFWQKDVFIYQDSYDNSIHRYTNESSDAMSFQNPAQLVILKCADNMIYVGEYCEENKISKILYGSDETDPSQWQVKALDTPTEINNIYISNDNEIFTIDSPTNTITNITTKDVLSYKGNFVAMNDKVIFSLLDNKVCLTSTQPSK